MAAELLAPGCVFVVVNCLSRRLLAALNILCWSVAIPLAFVNGHPAEEYVTVEPHLLCDSNILRPDPRARTRTFSLTHAYKHTQV